MSFTKPFSFGSTSTPSSNIFGSPAATASPQQQTQPTSIFGSSTGTSGFGAAATPKPATQTTLSFTSGGGFGFSKPATTASPFGQTTTTPATTTQSTFGFNKPGRLLNFI